MAHYGFFYLRRLWERRQSASKAVYERQNTTRLAPGVFQVTSAIFFCRKQREMR
jgi:glycerol-3-phosphate dehydrogenase